MSTACQLRDNGGGGPRQRENERGNPERVLEKGPTPCSGNGARRIPFMLQRVERKGPETKKGFPLRSVKYSGFNKNWKRVDRGWVKRKKTTTNTRNEGLEAKWPTRDLNWKCVDGRRCT